jgi:hypothetical protein
MFASLSAIASASIHEAWYLALIVASERLFLAYMSRHVSFYERWLVAFSNMHFFS